MIKKLIEKLMAPRVVKTAKSKFGKRVDITQADHGINRDLVDAKAWEVVTTLKDAGYEAFIVGGAVRDLLLGLRPKDFDVATNAEPEQVKRLFKRAFIIGRRFRIVHVVYGRGREHEVIEVSTFRAYLDNSAAEAVAGNEKTSKSELAGMTHAVDASGRVLRDNVWGPQDEDATRRDFTVNAMYYDPATQTVVDYHKGLEDAKKRTLRMIGDPATRYREDPVRIIRAVRFSAKLAALGFKLEAKTAKPLVASQALLADVPQSRLFDEMLKLLQTGHALASIAQLRVLGLARGIYPLLDLVVERAEDALVNAALKDTDRRVGEGKPVAPSFLLACVLWADVREGWQRRQQQGHNPFPALQDAIDAAFDARVGDVSGRGKLAADMREIWQMQPRFDRRSGSGPWSLVEQARFRAGFDFMRLRADVGEVEEALADWWQEFSLADDATRQDLLDQARQSQQRPKARRVPRATPAHGTQSSSQSGGQSAPGDRPPQPDGANDDPRDLGHPPHDRGHEAQLGDAAFDATPSDAAPKKRRRRRRGGRGGGADAGGSAGGAPSDQAD
jgi:poly(A) polymerase